jgi:FKBP-type peptidyl-prolyl cis-trans isomerase SlyD
LGNGDYFYLAGIFMQISKNAVAVLDYILKDDEGTILDQSEGGNFAYLVGTGQIIPGLETAMEGKQVGDELVVTIAAADAYGERELEKIQRVPRNMFPEDVDIKPGMQFEAQSPEGHVMLATVDSLDGDIVVVDHNHPLAGKTLHFDVKVTEVREASAEELEHGHVHGVGGHQH